MKVLVWLRMLVPGRAVFATKRGSSHQTRHHNPYLNGDGFVDFEPGDAENPQNWSHLRRWYITGCVMVLIFNANLASSIPAGSLDTMTSYFGVSSVAASLTITLFLLGYCAGPFVFAPLSEFYGRKKILQATFLAYMAFSFMCAFPPNFGGLLVARFFAGTAASATLSVGPGVLSDIWYPIERGNAMAALTCAIWAGPSIGPIASGFLELSHGWRWAFFVVLWLGAPATLLAFTVPETLAATILVKRARAIRKRQIPGFESVMAPSEANAPSLRRIYAVALTRPWALLFDPISFLCSVYMCVVYTLQYMLFTIYPVVFQQMRGWNAGVGQLPLLGTTVGACLGALVVFVDVRRRRKLVELGVELPPEDHLLIAMVGAVGFPTTMFLFAWTANYNSIHWIAPTIIGTFLSASLQLIFVAFLDYLVDTYHQHAASAVAVNTFARSVGSAAAPLFTPAMFSALGVGTGGSMIAAAAALLAVIPFAFHAKGKWIRSKSKYAFVGEERRMDEEARLNN